MIPRALENFQKAKALVEQLFACPPQDAIARRQPGVIQEKMCDVQSAIGDPPAAVANAQRSLAAFQALTDGNPRDVTAQQSSAIGYFKTDDVLGNPNFQMRRHCM
ncbi:MAG: hypothetical protein ACR2NX_03020 [Chthoniobacterales bacterium]